VTQVVVQIRASDRNVAGDRDLHAAARRPSPQNARGRIRRSFAIPRLTVVITAPLPIEAYLFGHPRADSKTVPIAGKFQHNPLRMVSRIEHPRRGDFGIRVQHLRKINNIKDL